jgi:hypothetical protein
LLAVDQFRHVTEEEASRQREEAIMQLKAM